MASIEHTTLSDFIKSVHQKLRHEAKILGTEKAWRNHCENEDLEKYAKAMHELATNHWENNFYKDKKIKSRITWVYDACIEYFKDIEKYRGKEIAIMKKLVSCDFTTDMLNLEPLINRKLKVLDVGSCYNPFKIFDLFEVTAIDIAPANQDVLKCDFLNLEVSNEVLIRENKVFKLKEGHFQVILFCLLLEYLPDPDLRLKCCENAYQLLEKEGVLIIITPDSNHIGSNAKIIKSWRYVLAKMGFIRVKYEKLPCLHCMVFRKACFKNVAERWAEIHASEEFFDKIFIPQDFNIKTPKKTENRITSNTVTRWTEETFLDNFNLDDL